MVVHSITVTTTEVDRMGKNVTARSSRANARALEAWNYRVLGLSWEEVAARVGYANAPNAYRAVQTFIGRVPQPDLAHIRQLWEARLDRVWVAASQELAKGKPNAVRNAVAVVERASRMSGLDAPTHVTLHEPDNDELSLLVRALIENAGLPLAIEGNPWDENIIDADVEEIEEAS